MTNRIVRELGTLIATSRGDGIYSRGVVRTVPLTLRAAIDLDSIERDEAGKIEFAYCHFTATFSPANWDSDQIGDPYTDTGITSAINSYLGSLGFEGKIGWSEQGRQERTTADFDMDNTLIDHLWPDLPKVSREAAETPTPR